MEGDVAVRLNLVVVVVAPGVRPAVRGDRDRVFSPTPLLVLIERESAETEPSWYVRETLGIFGFASAPTPDGMIPWPLYVVFGPFRRSRVPRLRVDLGT